MPPPPRLPMGNALSPPPRLQPITGALCPRGPLGSLYISSSILYQKGGLTLLCATAPLDDRWEAPSAAPPLPSRTVGVTLNKSELAVATWSFVSQRRVAPPHASHLVFCITKNESQLAHPPLQPAHPPLISIHPSSGGDPQ
jgi:hypothetical protein